LNIQQMRILTGKCKSSINGSFQQMGYSAQPQSQGLTTSFMAQLPEQFHDINELRNWTIRKRPQSVRPFVIPVPTNLRLTSPVVEKPIEWQMHSSIPCPVKWRYKFWDTIRSMNSTQPETSIMWN
jgi:hypothetical protein